jgi:hypothetical protein
MNEIEKRLENIEERLDDYAEALNIALKSINALNDWKRRKFLSSEEMKK